MLCQRCGNNLVDGANYCVRCGTKSYISDSDINQLSYSQEMERRNPQPENSQIAVVANEVILNENKETAVDETPLRTGQYFWIILISLIPIINFVSCISWAYGPTKNINIKNFAKSILIWIGIGMAFIGFTLMFVLYFTLAK